MSLQQAMQLASQNNEQLELSGEAYVQALINKNRAVAAFLPTVSFRPSFTIAQSPGGATPTGGVSGTSTSFRKVGNTIQQVDAPVVGNINVFRGFSDQANLRAAEATIAQQCGRRSIYRRRSCSMWCRPIT